MVVELNKRNMYESLSNAGVHNVFSDVTPQDILKNLEVPRNELSANESGLLSGKPCFESPTSLINGLANHFSKEYLENASFQSISCADARHSRLKKLVYSTLLSHRKEYVVHKDPKKVANPIEALATIKANEVEKLMWMTHVFFQQRQFYDATSLQRCLEALKGGGHLEADSDIRQTLKFLVCLKGTGEKQDTNYQTARSTATLTQTLRRPDFLPVGPMQNGGIYEYSTKRHYSMQFSPDFIQVTPLVQDDISPFITTTSLDLSSTSPGEGISPLLFPKEDSHIYGKVLGAMMQQRSKEMTPNMILSFPELPLNPSECYAFSRLSKALPSPHFGAVGSDEGYDTRPSSRQISEEEEEDIWERVLKEPPLTLCHTWESVGHPPVNKEKLFLSEIGPDAAHNVWIVYQELWSHMQDTPHVQPLCVTERSQLCQDILYLLSGVASLNFPWCPESQTFLMREGLCSPETTPRHLQASLTTLIECATYIRRLEMICISPPVHTRKVLIQGLVFHAFINAISTFLQVHRGKVLLLTGEKNLLQLLQKVKGLVRKVKFVSSICHISSEKDTEAAGSSNINPGKVVHTQKLHSQATHDAMRLKDTNDVNVRRSPVIGMNSEMPRGLNLLGELNNHLIVTKDKEYQKLLVFMMKSTCIPFFRYLEDWIYDGVCCDPGLEYMIDVDSASLLCRDRRYWTHGYTLRDLSPMPPFLREVLKEAFACGKALNLLKICSPKHYLVSGSIKHPSLRLCVSREELQEKHEECQAYSLHMDYVAAKKQVTVMQKEEALRKEKQQLLSTATKEHAEAIKQIERKLEEARQREVNRKYCELMELKEEMEKASEYKKEKIQSEAEEDRKILLEREKMEQKHREDEEKLRAKMERYYQQMVGAAEQRETLARWKVDRCLLNEARKQFIVNFDWTVEQSKEEDVVAKSNTSNANEQKGNAVNMKIEVTPLFVGNGTQFGGNDSSSNGLLGIEHDHIDFMEPSPTEESTSGCDMTVSRMSTSSDFVDTPHDENIPELEVDHEKSTVEKHDGMNGSSMRVKQQQQQAFGGNSYGRRKPGPEAGPIKDFPPNIDNPKLMAERIRQKVLREEYGMDIGTHEEAKVGDTNANYATIQREPIGGSGDDENGNLEDNVELAVANQVNANVTQHEVTSEVQTATQYPVSTGLEIVNEDDSNGNVCIPTRNDVISIYQETRSEAELIKQKVLREEFQTSMLQENNVNLIRSKRIPSSEAAANKQNYLNTEYGIRDTEGTISNPMKDSTLSYSRQVSATSTSTYRSCRSYDRQTSSSSSTIFTTPDEEKPILIDQEPALSPAGSFSETSIEEGIPSVQSVCKVQPYAVDSVALTGKDTVLDITGSVLYGKPSTAKIVRASTKVTPFPSRSELSCLPVSFVRSIRTHLDIQSRLVNSSLLSEVLVQDSLLDHFSAIRAFLLLHDAHFAQALILNLCTRIDITEAPATLLTPVVMNGILGKSISESCWSSSPFADNLSFAVTDTPARFTHQASILNCLELRYRVKWPQTLILDEAILVSYSHIWKFLVSLHYSLWAANDIFSFTSFLSRQDKEGRFVRCAQFHQVCLYCHQMHHFLLVLQAYVISQVHQTSWVDFEQKIRKKASSIDEIYVLHSELVNSIVSRCFLNQNGSVVLKLIHEVFSLMLQFRSQLKSHTWKTNSTSMKAEHPAFAGLQKTYKEFKKHATFLHKMLLRVVERHHLGHIQDLINRLDFNGFYGKLK